MGRRRCNGNGGGERMEALLIVAATALVNGLVTWGIVKTKLEHLDAGVKESKAMAAAAHRRIDGWLQHERR